MKTQPTLDIRRAFLALSAVALLILTAMTGISALLVWDAKTRLEPLREQASILADSQERLLDLLIGEQTALARQAGAGDAAARADLRRWDADLRALDAVVREVGATLKSLQTERGDYGRLNGLMALGAALLVGALGGLALVARERVLKPLGKLAHLLGRLAREDYRPEPLDGVDPLIRPPFESYNRLVGRLARLERAHQARHRRTETQVREAVRALMAQRAELARAERLAAVGEVAAALAHEVRNPLAAIRAACRSLIADTAEEDTRGRLRMIEEEIERLVDFVNRPLRGIAHRPEEPRPTDLVRPIRSLVRLMKYQMPRSVALRTDLPRRLEATLPPNGLRQVLLNLIKNSQEALGGREGSVLIAAGECEDGIELRVEDTGGGFPPDLLAAPIRRFVTGKSGGTGLGLAMAERYARDQGGRLEIGNRAEGGARVRICLPRREPPAARS